MSGFNPLREDRRAKIESDGRGTQKGGFAVVCLDEGHMAIGGDGEHESGQPCTRAKINNTPGRVGEKRNDLETIKDMAVPEQCAIVSPDQIYLFRPSHDQSLIGFQLFDGFT